MSDTPKAYEGHEQAITKHKLLQRYLDRLAHKWLYKGQEIAHVDGFAGPYGAGSEDFDYSSPAIAIETLRVVKKHLEDHDGKSRRVRCLFVEAIKKRHKELQEQLKDITDVEVAVLHGKFAECVDKIMEWLGRSFGLLFIDPEGFKDYPFSVVGPLLRRIPGEVIINFMFDFVNRAIDNPKPEAQRHLQNLFGDDWRNRFDQLLKRGLEREDAITELFSGRLRAVGNYTYVARTPVLRPDKDRTLYYLFYGTRKLEGLIAFREVEREAQIGQSSVRREVKHKREKEKTGMGDLFDAHETASHDDYQTFYERNMGLARSAFRQIMTDNDNVPFDDIIGTLLQKYMIRLTDAKDVAHEAKKEAKKEGLVEFDGLTGRAWKPDCLKGHRVISID